MKKFLIVLIFIFSKNIFAENVYCPQVVVCQNKHCSGPKNLDMSNQWGLKLTNAIFYFDQAVSVQLAKEYICNYSTYDKKSGIVLTSVAPVKADINFPENNWFDTANGKWGGVYYCQYNAMHCPFVTY